VDGVFVYRLADNGRIAMMRGYWDVQRVLADRTQAGQHNLS
jgi:hypothetical protein